jgi:hypothetical protein
MLKSIICSRARSVLVMAGFVVLPKLFYAANPSPFAPVNTPIGIAASATDLIVTEYCGQRVDSVDCPGKRYTFRYPSGAGRLPGTIRQHRSSPVPRRANNSDIYIMNANGSTVTKVPNSGAIDAEPALSASGRIVFSTNRNGNF